MCGNVSTQKGTLKDKVPHNMGVCSQLEQNCVDTLSEIYGLWGCSEIPCGILDNQIGVYWLKGVDS